jgi:hypothetical protein
MIQRLAVLAVLLCGCDLYFGDDDCDGWGMGGGAAPAYEVRDPYTGQCQTVGGGGGWDCDSSCGPCTYPAVAELSIADWGMCWGTCAGLEEESCFVAPGCYAAYLNDAETDGPPSFWGCWDTAPSGPVQGSCANLDAYECSRHDNCIAIYNEGTGGTQFATCAPEPATTCDSTSCAPGYHCEQQCYGTKADGTMSTCEAVCVADVGCEAVDCAPGYTCTQACYPDANGQTTCGPACVPETLACETLTTESACIARNDCVPVYDGQDCTCYPDGCTCQVLTYERCQTL